MLSIKEQPRTGGTRAPHTQRVRHTTRRARSPQPTTRPAFQQRDEQRRRGTRRGRDIKTTPPSLPHRHRCLRPHAKPDHVTAQPRPAPTSDAAPSAHNTTLHQRPHRRSPRKEDTNNQRGGQKQMHVMFPSPRVDPHSSANLRLQRQQSIRLIPLLNHTTPPLPLTTPTATPPPPQPPTTTTTCSRRPQTPSRCPGRALGVFGLITSRPLEIAV